MNFNSADWKEIKDYCEKQLADDVESLKSVAMGHEMTQYHRGRIAAFELLLDLPNNPTELEAD